MKMILDIEVENLIHRGGINTAREINQQPEIWCRTSEWVHSQKDELLSFLTPLFRKRDLNIILSGAGTSAFIGDTVQGIMQKKLGVPVRSIATTDVVTHPDLFIPTDRPVLLVSFARSGNSPESVKCVELAESLSTRVYHLIITCNADGFLAKQAPKKSQVIVLPEETNDKSLAMTSSFSSMLAAILMITDMITGASFMEKIELASGYAKYVLKNASNLLHEIAEHNFKRAIFLGSGPMLGIAREGHLKLQELSDGKVICKFDSFLGFRHGPRAVIDEQSLIVYFFSSDKYVSQYEKDLVCAVEKGRKGLFRLGIMEYDMQGLPLSEKIIYSDKPKLEDAYLTLSHIVSAQVLGFFKSLQIGLMPDNPSISGDISRVVQGVNLYPYVEAK